MSKSASEIETVLIVKAEFAATRMQVAFNAGNYELAAGISEELTRLLRVLAVVASVK